MGRITETHVT